MLVLPSGKFSDTESQRHLALNSRYLPGKPGKIAWMNGSGGHELWSRSLTTLSLDLVGMAMSYIVDGFDNGICIISVLLIQKRAQNKNARVKIEKIMRIVGTWANTVTVPLAAVF